MLTKKNLATMTMTKTMMLMVMVTLVLLLGGGSGGGGGSGAFASGTSSTSSSTSSSIIKLTDQTFEHQTQVSTGMTTGSWFVFFVESSKSCGTSQPCQQISSTLRKLATSSSSSSGDTLEDEEDETGSETEELAGSTSSLADEGILFASVDCETSPVTCYKRFNVLPPALLYFHKKAMYPYPAGGVGSSDNDNGEEETETDTEDVDVEFFNTDNVSEELVRKFVMEDYKFVDAMNIPPPSSPIDDLLNQFMELYDFGMKPENQLLFMAICGMAIMLIGTILVLIKTVLFSSSSSSSSTSVNNKNGKKKSTSTSTTKKTKTKTKKS